MNYKVAALVAVSVASAGTWLALGVEPCAQKVCCSRFPDRTLVDKHLCLLTGYMGFFVDATKHCVDGAWPAGIQVFPAIVNKIRGGIGDSNMDADVDLRDYIDFVGCLESTEPDRHPRLCLCPFDVNRDDEINLRDFADFQVAFGTGNTSWKAGE